MWKLSPNKPRLSGGMPVFSAEKYLKEAGTFILAQLYLDFELVISDNPSDDHMEQICREYATKRQRFARFE